jgi:hypothetical protein
MLKETLGLPAASASVMNSEHVEWAEMSPYTGQFAALLDDQAHRWQIECLANHTAAPHAPEGLILLDAPRSEPHHWLVVAGMVSALAWLVLLRLITRV